VHRTNKHKLILFVFIEAAMTERLSTFCLHNQV